ncbi:MAG: Uma2 family endonuclease, partial [Cyanobacteria bacterium P01_A01_bin.17]
RVAYDRGTLEIMTPLPEHEYYKEVLSDATKDIADALDRDYESYGSATWRRKIKEAGLEPDNCFYFQNESLVRGKLEFDLDRDPPPDLSLEIDLTSKSLNRLPIYARLGVPELWCYDDGEITIYHLQEGEYVEAVQSLVFPELPIQSLPDVIEEHRQQGRRALRQAIREWAKTYRTPL